MSGPIIVTGAAGFLGSRLVAALHERGYPVRSAVRVADAEDARQIGTGAIGPSTDWSAVVADGNCVLHCAARVHMMRDHAANPLQAFRDVNTSGTLNLARQAAAAGVRRFIFVSSIKVNGDATVAGRPFRADDPAMPSGDYAISKAEAEEGLKSLSAETGMEVVIVRPPLVYGPGVRANFASMVQWVARGLPLPFGAIQANRRSLVAVDNLIDLLIVCIAHPAAAGELFLVSDGEDLSTAALLRRIGVAVGRPARLLPVPASWLGRAAAAVGKGEISHRLLGNLQVDIEKSRRLLGWSPPVTVDEGLLRACAASRR